MAAFLSVHPQKPQPRLIHQAAEFLQKGVIVYPTDSYYALGCLQTNVDQIRRIRQLRGLGEDHHFTLSCKDLKQISDYALIDNVAFRQIKTHIPGPYTFVLKARKTLVRKVQQPSRQTMAFRILSHAVAQALLKVLQQPIITTTLTLANDKQPLAYDDMRSRLIGRVDAVLDAGAVLQKPTTILDFTEDPPRLIRDGGGQVDIIE